MLWAYLRNLEALKILRTHLRNLELLTYTGDTPLPSL